MGANSMKKCVLEEKECINCGKCDDRCELDPSKICDNCFRCLDTDSSPYAQIPITGVYTEDDYIPDAGDMHVEETRLWHLQTLYGLRGRYKRDLR